MNQAAKQTAELASDIDTLDIDVSALFKSGYHIIAGTAKQKSYYVSVAYPEVHVLNNFIGGHLRTRGIGDGAYPLPYLDFIDAVFGQEKNTIEVCSRHVKVDDIRTTFTVDINPSFQPSLVTDGQKLCGVPSQSFNRWRCDPPYNEKTAKLMYQTTLPSLYGLLKAGSRVCKIGSLLFLLASKNFQMCEGLGLKSIGAIPITVVPNNELRCCNIFYKYEHPSSLEEKDYSSQSVLPSAALDR